MSLPDSHPAAQESQVPNPGAIDVATATIWSGSCRTAIIASMGMIAVQVIQAILRAVEGSTTFESQPSGWRSFVTALSIVYAWLMAWAWFGLGRPTPLMAARNLTTKASIAKWGALVFAVCITITELMPKGGEVSSSRMAVLFVAALFGQLAYAAFAFWSIAHLKVLSRVVAQPSIRFNAHVTHVLVWATIVLLAGSMVYAVMTANSISDEPAMSRARDAVATQVAMLSLIATIVYCLAWGAYATTLASLRRAVQPLTFQAQATSTEAPAETGERTGSGTGAKLI